MQVVSATPYTEGCTLRSDYIFDPSACWRIPRSEASVSTPVALSTLNGSECDDGQKTSVRVEEGKPATYCMISASSDATSYWTRWSWITTSYPDTSGTGTGTYITETVETMKVPSSLEKCLPGSTHCWFRYQGTDCPNAHTPLSVAVATGTSTLFCCPSAGNLQGQLMTPASSITMIDDYGTSETLSWFDGPFLACGMLAVSYAPSALSMYGPNWYSVYSGGDVINDVMPTSSWLPGFEVATQGANVLMLKPIKVEVTATPKSVPSSAIASSTGTSSAGAFPAPSTELSSQSKIGIGVGVGLGVTLLLAIFGTLLLTRRAGKKNKLRVEAYSDKPELDGQTIKKEPYAVEIDDGHVHEIDGTDIPVETEASNHIQEVEDTGISVECDVPSNDPEMEANHGTTELGETSIR